MGGGGSTTTSTTNTQPPVPTVLPQLSPYISNLGQYAAAGLNAPGTTPLRFFNDQPIPVPGLSPLQQAGTNMIQQRTSQGLPVPFSEIANEQNLLNLPGRVSGQVPLSPYSSGAYNTAQQGTNTASTVNPFTVQGAGSLIGGSNPNALQLQAAQNLSQFGTGAGFGANSPAIQAAVQGLQHQIIPAIQNQAALSGLGNSGELQRQVGQAYAQQLVPLYQQGLQQAQQAAVEQGQLGSALQQQALQGGQALTGAGLGMTGQQLQALAQQAQTGLGVGQMQQGLGTEALSRQMYSTLSAAPQLQQIGLRQEQRPLDQIQQALQGGDLQRQLALQQQQAVLDSYMRARELSLGLMNPLGSFGATSFTPSQQTSSRTQPTGFGLSKS